MNRKASVFRRVLRSSLLFLLLLVFFSSCASYKADAFAKAALSSSDSSIEMVEKKGQLVFIPEKAEAGFIFYPGAMVAYEAYAPLLKALAEEGILVVDVKMPFDMAFNGINKAEGIQDEYPEIERWYVGGHSLGGAMASVYLKKHTEAYEGLVLLAAFSTADFSQTDLKILSIYGSEDKVLNGKSYEKYRENLGSFTEVILEGGCHAYFGSYGPQKGDGEPTISKEEQIKETVAAFKAFLDN